MLNLGGNCAYATRQALGRKSLRNTTPSDNFLSDSAGPFSSAKSSHKRPLMLRATPLSLLCFLILLCATHVTSLHSGKYCPQSCEALLNYVTFNDTADGLSLKIRNCRSEQHVTSTYLCMSIHCREDDGEIAKWIDEHSGWCERHSGAGLPDYHEVIDRWSPEDVERLPRFNKTEALSFPIFDHIALPSDRFFEQAFATLGGIQYLVLSKYFPCLHIPQKLPCMNTTYIWYMAGT